MRLGTELRIALLANPAPSQLIPTLQSVIYANQDLLLKKLQPKPVICAALGNIPTFMELRVALIVLLVRFLTRTEQRHVYFVRRAHFQNLNLKCVTCVSLVPILQLTDLQPAPSAPQVALL